MLYSVCTMKFDGWCTYHNEDLLYIIADSEKEAKEIYKKKINVGRKKIYVKESDKKGVVTFKRKHLNQNKNS